MNTRRFLMGRLRHAMSEEEKDVLESLIEEIVTLETGKLLVKRGEFCSVSSVLIEGFMLRTIYDGDQRYVLGVQVPGDFVDLHSFALKRLDHNVEALGEARIGLVPHDRLRDVLETRPHLARLLWFATLLDAAIHREWILKLEKLTATPRVAHIFCELWYRLDLVGLGSDRALRTPLRQIDLADMCGTTAIHMNRALAQLKKLGVAEFRRGTLYVPDRKKLEEFASFDPTYLYAEGELRVGDELSA